MNKNILSFSMVLFSVMVSGAIVGSAMAQTQNALQPQEQKLPGDIQFPISELGNCKSKEDCKIFCDSAKNMEVCLKFAEERKLLSPEELAMAKKFKEAGMVGPGECKGKDECDLYCNKADHMEECITFAQKNGMMSQKDLEESQKVLAAIKRGVKPPACSGKEECDKYCTSASHMEECMNFALEAGFMDKSKQEESKKILAAIKRGVKMPACNGQEECDAYCSSSEHMEECVTFGIEAGMMPKEEQEKAQKMLAAIKQGIKPPACRGEEECQKYCAQESHLEECVKFGEATGMMKPEDAAMMRKTGGKGPGGCVGQEVCRVFCDNPDNEQSCFNFAKDNGLIPDEDLKRMEEGKQKMKESFSQMPPEVLNCLTSALGADTMEKMKTGSGMPSKDAGEQIGKCFDQFVPQGMAPNNAGQPGQNFQAGPGGCKTPEECDVYCKEHQDECEKMFQPGPGVMNPGNQVMPQQAGPGGCKSPEECQKYCESNPEVCKNFGGEQGMGMGGQLAPGTQMNQIPPEVEKAMQMQIQEAINNGKLPPGIDVQNFELKDLNSLKNIQSQLPLQDGLAPAPGQQPGQNIQGQPGQPGQFIQIQPGQPMPSDNQINQMPPQGFVPPDIQMQYQDGPVPAPNQYPMPPVNVQ